ncbi:MAG: IPT/TIG domain-containing protein [Planctomycetota bacterium]|nr:IPT/TIG domain-containing protein [Planctomycetota bacterium]
MKPIRLALLLIFLVPLLTACADDLDLVVIERLAPGGGVRGDGASVTQARPTLDVLVRIESDATGFFPDNILRVQINGVDRTGDVVMGGVYALVRIDPAPVGVPQFIELFERLGPVRDTVTLTAEAFLGPTVASVTPNQARAGAQVTIAGTGFDAGALRVFFGGIEGTVDASDANSITATVPDGARTGLVYVLIGDAAAEGIVGFQLLDATDEPVPLPITLELFAVFPARGGIETALDIFGTNIDDLVRPNINDRGGDRVFRIETLEVDPIGEITRAIGVILPNTDGGADAIRLERGGEDSIELPFVVDADEE